MDEKERILSTKENHSSELFSTRQKINAGLTVRLVYLLCLLNVQDVKEVRHQQRGQWVVLPHIWVQLVNVLENM